MVCRIVFVLRRKQLFPSFIFFGCCSLLVLRRSNSAIYGREYMLIITRGTETLRGRCIPFEGLFLELMMNLFFISLDFAIRSNTKSFTNIFYYMQIFTRIKHYGCERDNCYMQDQLTKCEFCCMQCDLW